MNQTFTIASRDNVTLRAEGACMDFLEVVADMTNEHLERNKNEYAQAFSDLMLYGRSTVRFNPL